MNLDVLNSVQNLGIDKIQKQVSRAFYSKYKLDATGEIVATKIDFNTAVVLNDYFSKNFPNEWKQAYNFNHNQYAKINRLKKRISNMLKSSCLFLTLTFKDSVLSSTNFKTRRRYIQRFLLSLKCEYVANVDFGDKNGREHYHAIVNCEEVDCHSYLYGLINFQKIHNPNDCVKLSKYVAKLTFHAVKKTTKKNYLIYSKKY